MQMLFPVEGTAVNASQAAWVGAVAALLAGVRALSAGNPSNSPRTHSSESGRIATLIAMSVAVQAGWAIFGVLSGSRVGATGAGLLAANIALATPLAVICGPWSTQASRWSRLGMLAAAASLLGLPPFGGFAGQLMVGQAASNMSGIWLAVLLLGSALVAAGWLASWQIIGAAPDAEGAGEAAPVAAPRPLFAWSTLHLLILVLALTQVALFAASTQLAGALLPAGLEVPWLSLP
jgi:NADH:ubiquinone oxidoreductase subunit 2 (subunit N)